LNLKTGLFESVFWQGFQTMCNSILKNFFNKGTPLPIFYINAVNRRLDRYY
jgi:hypothetical protein